MRLIYQLSVESTVKVEKFVEKILFNAYPEGARQKNLAFLAGHSAKGGGGLTPRQLRRAGFKRIVTF